VEKNEKEALEKEQQAALETKVEFKSIHQLDSSAINSSGAVPPSPKDLMLVEMMQRTNQEKDVRHRLSITFVV